MTLTIKIVVKAKKTEKRIEKTEQERVARRARKEEKKKLREEQRAKEEQRGAEAKERPATKASEEAAAYLPQKQGLPALQPLKPLKQLPKLRMTTASETGSVVPSSCRSTAAETATTATCSWEVAAVEPSGWDSDETKTGEEKEVSNEIGIRCQSQGSGKDMVLGKYDAPSGWDSEDELAATAAPKALSTQIGQEPSGWDDSDDEKPIHEDFKASDMNATREVKAC